jgi:hypothetical protein
MNRKVIGYLEEGGVSNVMELLQDDFCFVPFYFSLNSKNTKVNCDAFLFSGLEGNSDYKSLSSYLNIFNIPILGIPRMSKLEQHIFFTNHSIQCPDYYNTNRNDKWVLPSLLEDIPSETQLIVKSMFGARGLEQILIKKKDLIRIILGNAYKSPPKKDLPFKKANKVPRVGNDDINDPNDLTSPAVEEKAPKLILGGDEEENYISKSFLDSNLKNWLITKKEFLKREFRILSFRGEGQLICERHINLNHFQNNLSVGSDVSYYGEEWSKLKEYKEKIVKYCNTLHFQYPSVPFFSLDIYVNDADEVGMFEFATEFGFVACDFDDVRKKAISSLNKLIV